MVEVSAWARKSPSCMQIYGGPEAKGWTKGDLGDEGSTKEDLLL